MCAKPNPFYRLLLLFSLNKNKRIVTVSEFSKNQILKCWLDNKKQKLVDYIYNFSNLEDSASILVATRKNEVRGS